MTEVEPFFVIATLWEYIEPLDRGDRYEDPLDNALATENLGGTCGGGTQLSNDCGIKSVDIELELNDLPRGLLLAKTVLEAQGAPKGSVLRYREAGIDKRIEFGTTECLAIFLDGVGLPDAVYEDSDINVLAEKIDEMLGNGSLGEIRASWCGPQETAIFVYGASAEAMYGALQDLLETYPLCQNARVVVRHGKAELDPRTIRIAMHS